MHTFKPKDKYQIKSTTEIAFPFLSILMAVYGFLNLNETVFTDMSWYILVFILVGAFIIIWIVTYAIICYIHRNKITLKINNVDVHIKKGDLFEEKELKVIPFNEYFDTEVDDVIIAKNSLNGIFIQRSSTDIQQLRRTIEEEPDELPTQKRIQHNGKRRYPLGRIIKYNDWLLLALTHFEKNQAILTQKDFVNALLFMWEEISRTYAHREVALPLLASGITRFTDTSSKSAIHILDTILFTLKINNAQINKPITIVLPKHIWESINFYELKHRY